MNYYKLTESDLQQMVDKKIISSDSMVEIVSMSKARVPGTFAIKTLQVEIAKGINLCSIRFYGGENFKQPYFFMAEITHNKRECDFTKFWYKHMANIPRRLMHY